MSRARSRRKSSVTISAVTEAERARPSSSASSPTMAPGSSSATGISPPLSECREIRNRPEATKKSESPGCPSRMIASPPFAVTGTTMSARDERSSSSIARSGSMVGGMTPPTPKVRRKTSIRRALSITSSRRHAPHRLMVQGLLRGPQGPRPRDNPKMSPARMGGCAPGFCNTTSLRNEALRGGGAPIWFSKLPGIPKAGSGSLPGVFRLAHPLAGWASALSRALAPAFPAMQRLRLREAVCVTRSAPVPRGLRAHTTCLECSRSSHRGCDGHAGAGICRLACKPIPPRTGVTSYRSGPLGCSSLAPSVGFTLG